MANQEVQVDTIVAIVDPKAANVTAKATLSHPKSGGWSMAISRNFIKGGNEPEDVALGTGAELTKKVLEVSAVMKNISATAQEMSLRVDALGESGTITGTIAPGHSAHYSMYVALMVLP